MKDEKLIFGGGNSVLGYCSDSGAAFVISDWAMSSVDPKSYYGNADL